MSYVPMATEHTAPGVLDQIEHDAKALVDTIRIEQSEIEVSQRRVAGAQEEARREEAGAEEEARADAANSPEAKLYGDLATEAMGGTAMKLMKDGMEFLSDADPGKGVKVGGRKVSTFEDMIKGANRKPGVYHDAPDASATKSLFEDGMSLTERCNLAASSITSQGDCNLTSWGIQSGDMPSTQMQRNMVFGKELASEAALASVARARALQAPMMGMGGGMMGRSAQPTVSLAQGPKFSMPEDEMAEESASWA